MNCAIRVTVNVHFLSGDHQFSLKEVFNDISSQIQLKHVKKIVNF